MLPKVVSFMLLYVTLDLAAASGVPVLIWGSDRSTNRLPVPLAGHTMQPDSFKRNYLDSIMPCRGCDGHNVVVFLKNKLSLEDLTQFGDVYSQSGEGGSFHNLKSYMESDDSLALTSVLEPATSLDYLKTLFNNIHQISSVGELERIPLGSSSRLVLVKLEDDHEIPISQRLTEHDKLVGAIVNSLQKKKIPYTAIFTAMKSEDNKKAKTVFSNVQGRGRHLLAEADLQADTAGIAVNVSGCFLMYYTKMEISTSKANSSADKAGDLIPMTGQPADDGSSCEKNKATIVLKWTLTGQSIKAVTLKMDIVASIYQSWYVANSTLEYDGSEEIAINPKDLGAPITFSYACGNLILRRSAGNSGDNVYLCATGFQMQAFAMSDGKFGYANDCTPFFSSGILAGLLVSFLLIAILSFGMMMVASISTMDRFDDPKGKPLNINAAEK